MDVTDFELINKDQIKNIEAFTKLNKFSDYIYSKQYEIFLPSKFLFMKEKILKFQVRPDDIWIMTYPKCGTTWTQEIIWCIMNNLNFEQAKKQHLEERFPFLELGCLIDEKLRPNAPKDKLNSVEFATNMNSPRLIKTHLPWPLLPQQIQNGDVKPKIIVVTRNPKDVVCSFHNHHRALYGTDASLDEFCEQFLQNYIMYGSMFKHLEYFLPHKNDENVLFLSFEEMKLDLSGNIKRIANFLNKCLSDEQIQLLSEHVSFEQMKNNPAVNNENDALEMKRMMGVKDTGERFMNKGQIGNYKNLLSEHHIEELDKLCQQFQRQFNFKFYL